MTLLNAPEYDRKKENLKRNSLIAGGIVIVLVFVVAFGGFMLGHGWFFSNLPAEHRVDAFLTALESKDFNKAYAIWTNDPAWQQHPQKYDYTIKRFTEDWTTESDWGPITSHHVDISKRTGTGVIVAVTVNQSEKKMFMWYERSNGTLTYPAPYNLGY